MCSNCQDNYIYFQCTQLLEWSRRLVDKDLHITESYQATRTQIYTQLVGSALVQKDKDEASGGNPA